MYTGVLVFFAVFLKNRKNISKIKRSKVTDYAALKVRHKFFSGKKYNFMHFEKKI